MPAPSPSLPLQLLHSAFLTILPRIERHAQVYFRDLRGDDRRAEAVQETVALAWKWFVRLAEQGKDAAAFPATFAGLAARAVRSGRRVAGMEKAQDVLNPRLQRKKGFVVRSLSGGSAVVGSAFAEALRDNTQTPPDEQAAFRLDFPAWLAGHSERRRRILLDLMAGERTLDVAHKHGTSPARVSQLRREFHQDWRRFTADPAER